MSKEVRQVASAELSSLVSDWTQTEAGDVISASFAVTPFTYYKLTLRAVVSAPALLGVVFTDAAGESLLADYYDELPAGHDCEEFVFYFQGKADASEATIRIHFYSQSDAPLCVEAIDVRPVERTEVAHWADTVWDTMPDLPEILPECGRETLVRTSQAMRVGGKLRVVMLGDSIINDTSNAPWDALVERHCPHLQLEVISSVRNTTGAWYYRHENRVETFVLRYKPDLLVIGGISHHEDIEAIRSVIHQVRQHAHPDILLCTGPVGRAGDPREDGTWQVAPCANSNDYRSRLRSLANEQGTAFLDMETAWKLYVQKSGKPYTWFLRDPVHANTRGRQVLARLMTRYFHQIRQLSEAP